MLAACNASESSATTSKLIKILLKIIILQTHMASGTWLPLTSACPQARHRMTTPLAFLPRASHVVRQLSREGSSVVRSRSQPQSRPRRKGRLERRTSLAFTHSAGVDASLSVAHSRRRNYPGTREARGRGGAWHTITRRIVWLLPTSDEPRAKVVFGAIKNKNKSVS